jgi:hypothetical protein
MGPGCKLTAAGARSGQDEHMSTQGSFPLEGGCDCGSVRYQLMKPPLIVHCCHCRSCQRESGASFVLNALIESDYLIDTGTPPQIVDTPSDSGKGQKIARCPTCYVAVWSNYYSAGPVIRFLRVGTLDEPDRLPPDIHIFTRSKQPWVILPKDVPAVEIYYERNAVWSAESLARRVLLQPRIDAYQSTR